MSAVLYGLCVFALGIFSGIAIANNRGLFSCIIAPLAHGIIFFVASRYGVFAQ